MYKLKTFSSKLISSYKAYSWDTTSTVQCHWPVKMGGSFAARQTALPLITRQTPKQSIRAQGLLSTSSGMHLGCPSMNRHSCPGSHSTVAQACSSGTHWAQHSPSRRNGTSPDPGMQTGATHKIPAQGSGRHWGQHSPLGTWRLSPIKRQRGGLGHSIVEQGWHTGQHSPSGITLVSSAWHCRSAGHCRSLQGSSFNLDPPPWSDAPIKI